MRDLLTDPLWQPADLGKPIPDSRHAVSVCLPTWADNVGYEEGDPRVVGRMQSGYPRFFYHPLVRKYGEVCRAKFAAEGEECLVFDSEESAAHFQRFLRQQTGGAADVRIHSGSQLGDAAVTFPSAFAATAKLGWQHLGGGITSRHAECCLKERSPVDAVADAASVGAEAGSFRHVEAKTILRNRVAELAGVPPDDVYLFPCGMNAVFAVHRTLRTLRPQARPVQFGFPYVDTLKILQKVGPGVHFLPRGDDADLRRVEEILASEQIAGLYTEFPSNPLLVCPDLERLDELSRRHGFPLIVDDTIAGFHNVDLLPAADVVVSSLTKSFSGAGDVTGGSVILNRNRPLYSELKTAFEREYHDALFAEDAIVLERNSRDYAERMPRINDAAERLVEFLAERPEVESVFYPGRKAESGRRKAEDGRRRAGSVSDRRSNPQFAIRNPQYDRFRKPNGGHGVLFSLVLKDGECNAPRFFDRLRISKGPNLGTNFSLACPFTILAHYTELDFAESCGVSRWLVRVSVGLEPPDDLIDRFADALV
jgi:cystathionine gamma-synthase